MDFTFLPIQIQHGIAVIAYAQFLIRDCWMTTTTRLLDLTPAVSRFVIVGSAVARTPA